MNLQPLPVRAEHMGAAFGSDPELELPERPRFIPELVTLPFGADGLLVVGANDRQLLRGRAARTLLPELLPLLDGRRTLDELAAAVPSLSATGVRDVIALLQSRGLLEDGDPGPPQPGLEHVDAFAGRYVDITRVNRNRAEVLGRVARTAILVTGAGEAAAEARERLAETGAAAAGSVAEAQLVLVVTEGEEERRADLPRLRPGTLVLPVRLGADEAALGPLLAAEEQPCARCLARLAGSPAGRPSVDDARFFGSLAALHGFHVASRLVGVGMHLHRAVRRFRKGPDGLLRDVVTVARTPGCDACGCGGPALEPGSDAERAWLEHVAGSLPPRRFISPRDHQQHYSAGNVQLKHEPTELRFPGPAVRLPAPLPLPPALPWRTRRPAASAVTLETLATVCGRSFGLHPDRAGGPWRIAPTGGSLFSPELFVAAHSVEGLPSGLYHYDGASHALGKLAAGPEDAFRLVAAPPAPALLLGVAALGRLRRKYGPLSARLSCLDAGVAFAYLRDVALALGLDVVEPPAVAATELVDLLGLGTIDGRYAPTFALALHDGPEGRRAAA